MKFAASISAALGLVAGSMAAPLEERDVQTVHLTFHGGPASYELAIPADGSIHYTNSDISINIIDTPDYNAIPQCTFYTNGEKELVNSITPDGQQHVLVGPPQPITGVSCQGICIPVYGQCYGTDGQYIGPCCNGFCAATRCRPWVQPS